MASGDYLFTLLAANSEPPGSLGATRDYIADASTPTVTFPVLDFDGSAQNEHADFLVCVPKQYSGGGFDFIVGYAMDGTGTGAIKFEIRAIDIVDTNVLTSDLGIDTQTAVAITDTPTGTANALMVCAAGSLSHANAGSPAISAWMLIRITRVYNYASNTGDAQFAYAYVTET